MPNNVRHRRKTRNPSQKVRRDTAKRFKRRKPLPQSIPGIIGAQWDRTQTVIENYTRLGLSRRLNGQTGGAASCVDGFQAGPLDLEEWTELDGGLAVADRVQGLDVAHAVDVIVENGNLQVDGEEEIEEGVIERDEHGNVLGVKLMKRRIQKAKPAEEKPQENNDVIAALEEHAKNELKRPVFLSPGQVEFVEACISKYNQDCKAMARDLKLNYMQWTPKQIGRLIDKYQQSGEKRGKLE